MKPATALKPTDCVSVSELADIFGFPTSVLVEAINRNRQAVKKPFYSIPELAKRWNCSRATVYNILRETELSVLNVAQKSAKKGKWNIPASVVEHIERSRTKTIPESEAA